MSSPDPATRPVPTATLETPDGRALPLDGTSSLGSSSSQNRHAFDFEKISRRHALIHAQEGGEFWLVDLGSTNGTFVNGERALQPRLLADNDEIDLAHSVQLRFRQNVSAEQIRALSTLRKTIMSVTEERRWLLVTDIANFSALSKKLSPARLAQTVGEFLAETSKLIVAQGGRINKYTGDGFLASWADEEGTAAAVAKAILDLQKLRGNVRLDFRGVVHCGLVAVGGTPTLGEETLLSDDLSLTFRLEDLAGKLKIPFLFSGVVAAQLAPHLALDPVEGSHELQGFPAAEGLSQLRQPA